VLTFPEMRFGEGSANLAPSTKRQRNALASLVQGGRDRRRRRALAHPGRTVGSVSTAQRPLPLVPAGIPGWRRAPCLGRATAALLVAAAFTIVGLLTTCIVPSGATRPVSLRVEHLFPRHAGGLP
jgi:hypothetical protein